MIKISSSYKVDENQPVCETVTFYQVFFFYLRVNLVSLDLQVLKAFKVFVATQGSKVLPVYGGPQGTRGQQAER